MTGGSVAPALGKRPWALDETEDFIPAKRAMFQRLLGSSALCGVDAPACQADPAAGRESTGAPGAPIRPCLRSKSSNSAGPDLDSGCDNCPANHSLATQSLLEETGCIRSGAGTSGEDHYEDKEAALYNYAHINEILREMHFSALRRRQAVPD